jgi:hypothetical protein
VDESVGSGVAEAGLRKCLEGVRIVGLPVRGQEEREDVGHEGDDGGEENGDWDDAWGGGGGGGGGADGDEVHEAPQKANKDDTAPSGDNRDLGLWEVERRLFADNQSARDVLEELGLELLSETEARALLRRRVELAG